MPINTSPHTRAEAVHWGSDIASVHFDSRGLVVVVTQSPLANGRFEGIQIQFKNSSAFRYMDEVDLARYWSSSGFIPGHHVLEVKSGGWSDEENGLQGYESNRREWLVVTGNGCLSVFAEEEPRIEVGEYEDAA